MGYLTNDYRGDIELEEEFTLQPYHLKKARVQPYFWRHRFYSPRYTKSLKKSFSYKQQVVIKLICKGFGRQHVKILMEYLMRGLEHQKKIEQDRVIMEDSYRQIINKDNYTETLDRWTKDFSSLSNIKDEELRQQLEQYSARLGELQEKKEDRNITDNELSELKELKSNNLLKDKVKFLQKDFTHMVISLGGKENVKKSYDVIRTFLDNNIKAKGFEYLIAHHKDTKNPHFHILVKNKNKIYSKSKFSIDKYDLLALRHDLSSICDRKGIDRTATRAYDRTEYLKSLYETPEKILKINNKYQADLARDGDKYSFNAFKQREKIQKDINNFIKKIEREQKREPNLKKTLKILRSAKRETQVVSFDDFHRMKGKTTKELEKYSKKIAVDFKDYLNYPDGSMDKKQKKQIKSMVIKSAKRLEEELRETLIAVQEYKKKAPSKQKTHVDNLTQDLKEIFSQNLHFLMDIEAQELKRRKEKEREAKRKSPPTKTKGKDDDFDIGM